jgi:hypothetical protein
MTTEIIKVDYSLQGFNAPVGIAAELTQDDVKIRSIQLAQSNHRCFKVPGIKVPQGSFIDGDNFDLIAEAFGSEKHPAPGIDLIFFHLEKYWTVSEREQKPNGKFKAGEFIEKVKFNAATAALNMLPDYRDKHCALTYRYFVKIVGDDIPAVMNFKGNATPCAIELNSQFRDLWEREKRASFSKVFNLKTRTKPLDEGEIFIPYINSSYDCPEVDYLKAMKFCEQASKYSEEADRKEEKSMDAPPPSATTQMVKDAFDGAIELSEDDLDV